MRGSQGDYQETTNARVAPQERLARILRPICAPAPPSSHLAAMFEARPAQSCAPVATRHRSPAFPRAPPALAAPHPPRGEAGRRQQGRWRRHPPERTPSIPQGRLDRPPWGVRWEPRGTPLWDPGNRRGTPAPPKCCCEPRRARTAALPVPACGSGVACRPLQLRIEPCGSPPAQSMTSMWDSIWGLGFGQRSF